MQLSRKFVLIDDDPINNMITTMSLKKSLGEADVIDFVDPEIGLDYIEHVFLHKHGEKNITVFLDLNMPKMNGWEFIERFDLLNDELKDHIDIYILSSSVDIRDKQKATLNPSVTDFIEKPLTIGLLQKMFG